ncbi:hypothetical protein HanIR_Chr15g0771221 [Helianthus annuus]|nr:hypothetical protein HanIR_Chr15g0771221 [Helianthus annuus]
MFVHLTNELPAERFTNCSLNVWFVCSPDSLLTKICPYKERKSTLPETMHARNH